MSGESNANEVLTGYKDLDRMTYGLHKGDLVVLAARPSMGKTSLALSIAEHAVLPKNGDPVKVLVFTLEMDMGMVSTRMLCHRANVNMRRLRDGTLSKEDQRNIASAAHDLASAPLWVDDKGYATIESLEDEARRMQASILQGSKEGLGLIIIDYLQMISGTTNMQLPRDQQIAEITRRLKGLAKEINVPILLLSQLIRLSERDDRSPRLSDLRDSGAIEEDADVVLLLSKDHESDDAASVPSGTRKVELIIAKQRNGPVGSISLIFIPEYTSFENFIEAV